MKTLELRLPADEFRSLPVPGHKSNGKAAKLGSTFLNVEDLDPALGEWLGVNPRMPARKGDAQALAGRVARRIMGTLKESPELFALKNMGIWLLVDSVEQIKEPGGRAFVKVRLTDPERHGIVNGGHTFFAIRQVVEDGELGEDASAFVRLHIMEGIDPGCIVDIAEGLNRSLQVKDASLSNLEGAFDRMKGALKGKHGAEEISYFMGHPGSVDVQDVLAQMAAMNLNLFPDENKQPNVLFGQPAKVLDGFLSDMKKKDSAYRILIQRMHEILVLFERVAEETSKHTHKQPRLGGLGKNRGKNLQAKNPRPAIFAEGRVIERRYFNGLVYPIFSAFRANVDPRAWKQGRFEWLADPEALLTETVDQLCAVVRTAYEDNRSDPAVVGKKHAAYFACYQVVLVKLARMGKLAA